MKAAAKQVKKPYRTVVHTVVAVFKVSSYFFKSFEKVTSSDGYFGRFFK